MTSASSAAGVPWHRRPHSTTEEAVSTATRSTTITKRMATASSVVTTRPIGPRIAQSDSPTHCRWRRRSRPRSDQQNARGGIVSYSRRLLNMLPGRAARRCSNPTGDPSTKPASPPSRDAATPNRPSSTPRVASLRLAPSSSARIATMSSKSSMDPLKKSSTPPGVPPWYDARRCAALPWCTSSAVRIVWRKGRIAEASWDCAKMLGKKSTAERPLVRCYGPQLWIAGRC
mmetsp:Transcript_23971/g.41031  ORF Transcript_23971/g.41031 Transcript_23971/m.41031 type:complete len:230 (+) Transcript_23971:198-887(+)